MAISNRIKKVKDIANALGIEDNALATYLSRMLDGASLEKRTTFNGSKKPFIMRYPILLLDFIIASSIPIIH